MTEIEIEYYQKIPMVYFDDSSKIRSLISTLKLNDDFKTLAVDSHKAEAFAVMSGRKMDTQHKLRIFYSIGVQVAAGSIIKGFAIAFFPNGKEQVQIAEDFIKDLIVYVSESMPDYAVRTFTLV